MKDTKAKRALNTLSYELGQEAHMAASEQDISVQPRDIIEAAAAGYTLYQLVEGIRDQAVFFSKMAKTSRPDCAEEWDLLALQLDDIVNDKSALKTTTRNLLK